MALLLDYDGTLAPLVSHPDLAVMEPESQIALNNLVMNPNVYLGFISGRSVDDARTKIRMENVTYAGNHGLEIVFRNKSRYNHKIDEKILQSYEKMVAELETTVSDSCTEFQVFNFYACFCRNDADDTRWHILCMSNLCDILYMAIQFSFEFVRSFDS